MQKLIFTDLDGTLIDHVTYSFSKAKDALKLVKKKKIPLVVCTSKSKAEIEFYRKKIGNKHPFISENGGAIFIPKKYFDFKFEYNKKNKDYYIIQLGADYKKILDVIKKIKKKVDIINFHSMSVKKISEDAGLTLSQAKLSKKRDYDEPFKILEKGNEIKVKQIVKKNKLKLVKGGRYYHLVGDNDKGKAVKILVKLYQQKFKQVRTYAFGDSNNDFAMLNVVDEPYLVKKYNKGYTSDKFKKAGGIGPVGWNKTVLKVIK